MGRRRDGNDNGNDCRDGQVEEINALKSLGDRQGILNLIDKSMLWR